MKITENSLDGWVRANSRDAQGIIVDLVFRLVCASVPYPLERRFPQRDSIGQPGPDGVLHTQSSFNPFVPEGRSYWEIGTGENAGTKATSDYKELTEAIDEEERFQATFIFVTPLSARKDWQHTWKDDAQVNWLKKRRKLKEWRDVWVIDGTKLIDWIGHFPSVEQWLNTEMGFPTEYLQTTEQRWNDLKLIGDPPPLDTGLFLINRAEACTKLHEILDGESIRLKVDTHFPNQLADFVAAYIASLEKNSQLDIVNRCLIISSPIAWDAIASLRDKHVLIADFDLNDTESGGMMLLERAKRGGHAVIFADMPGGIPGLNRVNMPSPNTYQVEQALVQTGYPDQRARSLAQKSSGNLNSLLRCLRNLSLLPQWV